jgi:8-oxo-dGTP diphosphatase
MKQGAIGIIFNKDRTQVLIIQRCDVPVWVLPGGGIDFKETPEQAIIREIYEETGLKVTINRKVALYTPVNRLSAPTHLFECRITGGHMKTGPETRALGFYPIDRLPPNFFYLHRFWLHDALIQHPFLIQKKISQITYGQLFKYFLRHPTHVIRFALSQLGFPIKTK